MENYQGFAQVYDALMQEDLDYPGMADFILKYAPAGENYLDLGAGTASLSVLLAPRFKRTYLVDRSPDMLALAMEKMEAAKITGVRAFELPMEAVDFPNQFTLVTSSVDSLNYILEESLLLETFQRVHGSLKEDGVFIFDLQSPYKLREVLGDNEYMYTSDDVVYTWVNQWADPVVEMTLNFFVRRGALYERFEEVHRERAYEPDRVHALLTLSGFQRIEMFDDYEEKPLSPKTERMVFVAWKQ